MELPYTIVLQMQQVNCKKVLNAYKENISAEYVSDIEIEEPPPLYDRDNQE